jgi:hypothetical protein
LLWRSNSSIVVLKNHLRWRLILFTPKILKWCQVLGKLEHLRLTQSTSYIAGNFHRLIQSCKIPQAQICDLLLCYAVYCGNRLQMFRDNLSAPTSWVENPPLKMGQIGCPETSVSNYHYKLRKIPEERKSRILRDGTLKSRNKRTTDLRPLNIYALSNDPDMSPLFRTGQPFSNCPINFWISIDKEINKQIRYVECVTYTRGILDGTENVQLQKLSRFAWLYQTYKLSVLEGSRIPKKHHYLVRSQVSSVWPSVKSSCEEEDERGALVVWEKQRKAKLLWGKLVLLALCPLQIPHKMAQPRHQALNWN